MSIVQGTLPVGSLDQAITLNVQSSGESHFETVTTTTPYLHRASPQDVASSMKLKKVVGGTIAWNQLMENVLTSYNNNGVTASYSNGVYSFSGTATSDISIALVTTPQSIIGHKYLRGYTFGSASTYFLYGNAMVIRSYLAPQIYEATWSGQGALALRVLSGSNVDGVKFTLNVYDLTQMFGSTIADYIYSLEQAHAGDGVAWFKALFGEDYYPYNGGELLSVKTSARKTYNADNVEIGSYALDNDLELRGIPKLDSNNELYYDGDTYVSDGTVTRKYGIRAYTEGDATDGSTMITDGTNTVYKLITPTTESADAYTQSQRVGATEEFVDGRTVEIPVGNVSEYKRLIQED